MKKLLFIAFIILFSIVTNAQNILSKKVLDLNMNEDYQELIDVGVKPLEINIMGILLLEKINKGQDIDTLTVNHFLQEIESLPSGKIELYTEIIESRDLNNEKKSTIIKNDEEILSLIDSIKGKAILIFGSSGCVKSKSLLNDLQSTEASEAISDFKIYYFDVQNKTNGKSLLNRQNELFGKSIQPFSVLIINGEIVKDHTGYNSLTDFLNYFNE